MRDFATSFFHARLNLSHVEQIREMPKSMVEALYRSGLSDEAAAENFAKIVETEIKSGKLPKRHSDYQAALLNAFSASDDADVGAIAPFISRYMEHTKMTIREVLLNPHFIARESYYPASRRFVEMAVDGENASSSVILKLWRAGEEGADRVSDIKEILFEAMKETLADLREVKFGGDLFKAQRHSQRWKRLQLEAKFIRNSIQIIHSKLKFSVTARPLGDLGSRTASSLPCDVQEARLSRSSLPPTNLIQGDGSYLGLDNAGGESSYNFPSFGQIFIWCTTLWKL